MRAILVIDDDDAAAILAAALRTAGYDDVIRARDVADVDRAAAELVALDTTRERRLAAIPRLARRTTVLALAPDDALPAALAAGAGDVLALPLRANEVAARVAAIEHARRVTASLAKLQHANDELERLACLDAATGLPNRRHALARLEVEERRAARDRGVLAVAMLDVDHFQAYAGEHGERAADECMRRVASAVARALRRPGDFAGRFGGDELLVVLPNTNAAGARVVAERLRAGVEALAIAHASPTARVVTVSAGVAASERGERPVVELVAGAERALLRAKLAGRNRCAVEPVARAPRVACAGGAHERFVPVIADAWSQPRIASFLAAARDEIAGFVGGGRDGAALVARRLGARASELGFDQLRRLADDLERAIEPEIARECVDEIGEYLAHVRVVYRPAQSSR